MRANIHTDIKLFIQIFPQSLTLGKFFFHADEKERTRIIKLEGRRDSRFNA